MYSVMGSKNSQSSPQGCSIAKKSKTNNDDVQRVPTGCWDRLPAIIIDDIFQYLNFKDSINASSTCYNWRQALYHPRKWESAHFVIEPDNLEKAQYFRLRAGPLVVNATVTFNSIEAECVNEFIYLMQTFASQNKLQSLAIEPSHSVIDTEHMLTCVEDQPFFEAIAEIHSRHSLTTLNIGCSEELFQSLPDLLQLFDDKKSEQVKTLALATVKADPCNYPMQSFEIPQIAAFRRVQIFSLDYDNLNDEVLHTLGYLDDLQRIIVHVHGIWDTHPGTSEDAWLQLRIRHPKCLLRMSCIHSIDEVLQLHTKVFKSNMPLSHLKMMFCEQMNVELIEYLPTYRETLVSLMWVDNLYNVDKYRFLRGEEGSHPQELIIFAWLCRKLSELVFIGYKFNEENWVGISKLRDDTLKRLEVAKSDIVPFDCSGISPDAFGKSWKALEDSELHPAIINPYATYTDEYLLPILLADLK